MKKKGAKKLVLAKETLRELETGEIRKVVGATVFTCGYSDEYEIRNGYICPAYMP